ADFMPKLPRGMFRRGASYYTRIYRGGADRWISLGPDFGDACRRLRAIEAYDVPLGRFTVAQTARRWVESYVRHVDPARVLEPRGEEVDPLLAPVEVAHVDLAEVMLRELARQALEPHQGGDRPWTQSAHRLVQRRLRSIVAQAPQAVQNLDRLQLRLSREHVDDPVAILLDHARPSDA